MNKKRIKVILKAEESPQYHRPLKALRHSPSHIERRLQWAVEICTRQFHFGAV